MTDFSKPVEYVEHRVSPEYAGLRVDKFLTKRLNWQSRQYYLNLFTEKKVTVNGRTVKKSFRVSAEDIVKIKLPEMYNQQFDYASIPLAFVYEDDDMVVVNKSGNMAVQPAGRYIHNNLLYRLKYYYREEKPEPKTDVSIVHRIDLETSGVIVFAKNREAASKLTSQFERREVKKQYLAVVHGCPDPAQGTIDVPLLSTETEHMIVDERGKSSQTDFKLEKKLGKLSLMRMFPYTGRQHQIRVHLLSIGHPIISDGIYGDSVDRVNPELMTRQALHAAVLEINHPNGERMTFEAQLHDDIASVVSRHFKEDSGI